MEKQSYSYTIDKEEFDNSDYLEFEDETGKKRIFMSKEKGLLLIKRFVRHLIDRGRVQIVPGQEKFFMEINSPEFITAYQKEGYEEDDEDTHI